MRFCVTTSHFNMDRRALIDLHILSIFIPRALSLVGGGVCNKSGREECCYLYHRIDQFCIPCPSGTFGTNCSQLCSKTNAYGDGCSHSCNCNDLEVCHPSEGCVPRKEYGQQAITPLTLYHESTHSKAQRGNLTSVTESGVPFNLTACGDQVQGQGIFAYFSISELAILGALLLLIVLVIVNIIVARKHVLKVKHGSYQINGNYHHGNGEMASPRRRNRYCTSRNVTLNGANRTTNLTVNGTERTRTRRVREEWTPGNQSTLTSAFSDDSCWSDFDENENGDVQELVNYSHNVADNREYFSFEDL